MTLNKITDRAREMCGKTCISVWGPASKPFPHQPAIDFWLYVMPKDAPIIRFLNAMGKRAITLGECVIVRAGELSPALIRHEAVHVGQWRAKGWRFGLIYLMNPKQYEGPAEAAENA